MRVYFDYLCNLQTRALIFTSCNIKVSFTKIWLRGKKTFNFSLNQILSSKLLTEQSIVNFAFFIQCFESLDALSSLFCVMVTGDLSRRTKLNLT
ncbi:hypothetical protein NSTC745_05165 [Nostoc sp. DSM 114161]